MQMTLQAARRCDSYQGPDFLGRQFKLVMDQVEQDFRNTSVYQYFRKVMGEATPDEGDEGRVEIIDMRGPEPRVIHLN